MISVAHFNIGRNIEHQVLDTIHCNAAFTKLMRCYKEGSTECLADLKQLALFFDAQKISKDEYSYTHLLELATLLNDKVQFDKLVIAFKRQQRVPNEYYISLLTHSYVYVFNNYAAAVAVFENAALDHIDERGRDNAFHAYLALHNYATLIELGHEIVEYHGKIKDGTFYTSITELKRRERWQDIVVLSKLSPDSLGLSEDHTEFRHPYALDKHFIPKPALLSNILFEANFRLGHYHAALEVIVPLLKLTPKVIAKHNYARLMRLRNSHLDEELAVAVADGFIQVTSLLINGSCEQAAQLVECFSAALKAINFGHYAEFDAVISANGLSRVAKFPDWFKLNIVEELHQQLSGIPAAAATLFEFSLEPTLKIDGRAEVVIF